MAASYGSRRTPKKDSVRWVLIAIGGTALSVAVVLVVLGVSGIFGGSRSDSPGASSVTGDLDPDVAVRLAAGGRSAGPPSAPVTVLEFADFQCPYCRAFWAGSLARLKDEFVTTGRARLVYRHTVVVGPESQLAAEASECAADQGRFFEYHDVLFEQQGSENAGYLTASRLSAFARRIGLDQAAFDRCVAAGTHRSDVIRQSEEAVSSGIRSTPSVYVNGRRVANPFDYAALRAAVIAAGAGG